MRLLFAVSVVVLLPVSGLCQTMVESAILSGSVAASASGTASATGSALSKALGKIDGTLSRAAGGTATPLVRERWPAVTSPLPKPPQAAFEGIATGTTRTDLIAKAGKPQFSIASSDGEVLHYSTREGGSIRISILDGQVATVEQTPPKPAATPAPTSADPGK
ncbi:MAG TPA: hypothetical protein VGK29_22030 [Paludibaculum sp.]|jgi:hypothetical protein